MYIIDRTNRGYSKSMNRSSDYQELVHESKTNPDPGARELARLAADEIRKEAKPIRDMRESLIKAHRRGETDEVKDIHDIVSKKSKYRHER